MSIGRIYSQLRSATSCYTLSWVGIMTVVTADRRVPAPTGCHSDGAATAGRRTARRLARTWPLTALFAGYPLWWLLGITDLVSVAMVSVMAFHLVARRSLRVPRGFGVWLLFLAWVALGFFVVHVVAPGTADSSGGSSRYLTWGFRLVWYLQATVVVLFVVNLREDHSVTRIFRAMGWMFVTIVAGGFIGVVLPHLDIPSLLELALPRSVSHIAFVKSQIHPNLAELQNSLYGPASSRPSAPFPYANVWGLNYACFLPFFVVGWFRGTSGRRRCIGGAVLALSVVPVVYSLNRGLWGALAALIAFTIVRSAGVKRARTLVGLLALILVAGITIAVTPLGPTIGHRFSGRNSNQGRTQLTAMAIEGMTSTSPVVGFGTTRAVPTSFNSIAVGATADCPLCSPPALGTQGQLSLVGFCEGWGGLVLYYGFLILVLLRYIRLKSPAAVAAIGVLIVHLITSPIYSADNIAILAIFCAIGVLERVRAAEAPRARRASTVPVSFPAGRGAFLRRNLAYLVAPVLILTFAGWAIGRQVHTVTATVSMNISAEQAYPGVLSAPRTLDTEAQLITSHDVAQSVARLTAQTPGEVLERMAITARPNSRILNLSYRAPNARLAGASVNAASTALLHLRTQQLSAREAAALATIDTRTKAVERGLRTVNDGFNVLQRSQSAEVRDARRGSLLGEAYRLYAESTRLDAQRQRAESLPLSPGNLLSPVSYTVRSDRTHVWFASGLALGLLLGLLLAVSREALGFRVSRASRNGYLEPKLLGVVDSADVPVVTAFASSATYLSVDPRVPRSRQPHEPSAVAGPAADPSQVVLVATPRTPASRVNRAFYRLSHTGVDVIGLVVVRDEQRRFEASS